MPASCSSDVSIVRYIQQPELFILLRFPLEFTIASYATAFEDDL
jgi:hypothetical protein